MHKSIPISKHTNMYMFKFSLILCNCEPSKTALNSVTFMKTINLKYSNYTY